MNEQPPNIIPNTQTNIPDQQPSNELPTRWEIELEFVQSLANIQYLNYLGQSGFFKDEKFLNYLNYLNYWKDPNYSKFLVYPNCLHILTLLQNSQFRDSINDQNFINLLFNDMVELWKEPLLIEDKEREKDGNKKTVTNDKIDNNVNHDLKNDTVINSNIDNQSAQNTEIDKTSIDPVQDNKNVNEVSGNIDTETTNENANANENENGIENGNDTTIKENNNQDVVMEDRPPPPPPPPADTVENNQAV